MNVYIVVENIAAYTPNPEDLDTAIIGVFSAQKNAEDCLGQHVSYIHSQKGLQLIVEDGMAYDDSGFIFFEIIERDIQ